jgi:hypothetical protein
LIKACLADNSFFHGRDTCSGNFNELFSPYLVVEGVYLLGLSCQYKPLWLYRKLKPEMFFLIGYGEKPSGAIENTIIGNDKHLSKSENQPYSYTSPID